MVNTATSSINRKYFVFLLKNNKRYIFLYGFALLIAFPVFVLSLSTTVDIENLYYIGKVLNLLIVIAGTILIPLMLFQFTTSRRSVDVFHALPIQKEFLFMTNYFAGITMLLVPYLLSNVLGVGISLVMGMSTISLAMEVSNFLLVSLTLLVSYSITMFAKKNCGTVIDAFLYTIVLHLLPILTYVAYYSFSYQLLLGFNEPFSSTLFYYLTPFPAMFINALHTTNNFTVNIPVAAYWFYGILVLVLYVVCSYLFLNHKSESTNMPFVNRYFYPIVSFVTTVIAIILIHTFMNSVFNYDGISSYIFPLLVGAIVYLVMDVIANRGFRHFAKTILRFGMISAVVLTLILPTRFTNGFGYITRVPDLENIESVTVDVNYPLSSYLGFGDYYTGNTFTLTKREEISVIRDLHLLVLQKYETIGYEKNDYYRHLFDVDHSDQVVTFSFEYDLGLTKMKRQYTASLSWLESILKLAASDAMIDARYPMVVSSEQYKISAILLSDPFKTTKLPIYHSIASYSWDKDELMDALELDLKSETDAEFFDSTIPTIGNIEIQTTQSYDFVRNTTIPIKASYTNTLKFLSDNNISLPQMDVSQLITSQMIVVYPEPNDSRMAFYWNSQSDYSPKIEFYGFSYKKVTYQELQDLLPLVHYSYYSEEPNLLLYIMAPDSTLTSYQIRYKDKDLVNSIVQGELHFDASSVYDVMSRVNNK